MLQSLQKNDVDYILVGAYALAAQGFPRSTMDIEDAKILKNKS